MEMLLTEVERAYLAGFFDADGAIMAIIEKHHEKKFGYRIRLFVKIAQKSKNVPEKELCRGDSRKWPWLCLIIVFLLIQTYTPTYTRLCHYLKKML